jgi:drug/metabolite transporter (DMT)-like permease
MNLPLLLTGLASGFLHSVYSAVSKHVIKSRVPTPFVFFLYINVFQAVVSLPLWLFVKPVFPPPEASASLLAAGLTCALAYVFLYAALSCGDVSSVMPIMGSKVVFSGILGHLMLGETHVWPVYLAVGLVAVSVAALSYSPASGNRSRFQTKPTVLILLTCVVFSFTDIFIKRSVVALDSYNFMVEYNLIVAAASLLIIPFLKVRKIRLRIPLKDAGTILLASAVLLVSTLLFVMAMAMADGVIVPNILQATRGVFIVLITFALTRRGNSALDVQSGRVYALRFAASLLIILSIAIVVSS